MKRMIETLEGRQVDRPPFWFMRQAGRYLPEYREIRKNAQSFLDLCYTPELASEITLQPLRRFGMDAAILFSDILVVPHALGQDVRFVEGEGPKLKPIEKQEDIESLDLSRIRSHTAPVCETLRRVRASLSPEQTLIGFAGSPWTVACYMVEGGGSREYEKARAFAYRHPDAFAALIDKVGAATLDYLSAQVEAGADCLQLFDSWAGVLSEQGFNRWVIEPTAALVASLKARFPALRIIGFPRLAGNRYLAYARETGVDAISVDYGVPLEYMKELQKFVTVQGNLDPLLLMTDAERTLAEARRLREALGRERFIFNLGHGMPQHTPVEHVQRLSDYLRKS